MDADPDAWKRERVTDDPYMGEADVVSVEVDRPGGTDWPPFVQVPNHGHLAFTAASSTPET